NAIMKATGAKKGIIAIELNKPDAIASIRNAIKGKENISVAPLKTKYPEGYEKSLIYSIAKRKVPPGKLPMDVGCVVFNISTAAAISQTIRTGMPLIERVVTVSGSGIAEPSNLLVRIGTSFQDAIAECGGLKGEIKKILNGGPLMGIAMWSLDVPVIKGVTGILAFTEKECEEVETEPCIRCAKCVDVCPVALLPTLLESYFEAGNIRECRKLGVLDCMECGACSYICPSKRNLVQNIKLAKEAAIK
ncbi:MAG: RnfABCDGE type electron transport complex subunit C, partial [Candidatus Saganbacteria bacterium]|nr:RnfABCDGE type electron transport complex subunit C [Candidatus Saganbacteria bacterium]